MSPDGTGLQVLVTDRDGNIVGVDYDHRSVSRGELELPPYKYIVSITNLIESHTLVGMKWWFLLPSYSSMHRGDQDMVSQQNFFLHID